MKPMYYRIKQKRALTRAQYEAIHTLLPDYFALTGYNEDADLLMKDYMQSRISKLEDEFDKLEDEWADLKNLLATYSKWADNVREFFGDELMMDFYDKYGGLE